MTPTRLLCLAALLTLAGGRGPAAEPLTRVEIGKIGKAGTALIEVKDQRTYGSAFCVHPSGLFVTNDHIAQGDITLILNPGLKDEKAYKATVVRSDKAADLSLLRIDGVKDLPTLALGSDEKLTELAELVAVGFPFGKDLTLDRKGYPEVSVNVGSVTSLRRKDGALERIQLDAALNPGNSGGPVLDKNGQVVGVVVAGVRGSGVNFAIPVSVVRRFASAPDISFEPPVLEAVNVHKPVRFEARIASVIPDPVPFTVELVLKPTRGKERTLRMEAADSCYHVSAVPMPPAPGELTLRLLARFDNGTLNATTPDTAFKVGDREVKLSEVRAVRLQPAAQVTLADGKVLAGAIVGLSAVPTKLGGQSIPVDLSKALDVRFAPALEADLVWYTLIVRRGDKEVLRRGEALAVQGALPTPAVAGASSIAPPPLDADTAVRKLAAPVTDVAVGGGGRYLVLHLPKLQKLAVFDVNAAEIVGHIPVADDAVKFTAGSEYVVVVLPGTGTVERWNLKALEREVATPLPVKETILTVVMGSASKGPLLVQSVPVGVGQLDPVSYTLLNPETMKVEPGRPVPAIQAVMHRRSVGPIRAAANGQVFGMWRLTTSPSGVQTLIVSDSDARAAYAHSTVGHIVPGPDGKELFTRTGRYPSQAPERDFQKSSGAPVLPAAHGTSYLTFPAGGKPGDVTINVPGQATPLFTVKDLGLTVPDETTLKGDFTFDKRVHYIPDARLIITIPASNDRLLLYRVGK